MKRLLLVLALATVAGCYGSYSAFHALHRWNGHATNSKVANSAIHAGLLIVPIYELMLLGDVIIFNNIEFFTDQPVFR